MDACERKPLTEAPAPIRCGFEVLLFQVFLIFFFLFFFLFLTQLNSQQLLANENECGNISLVFFFFFYSLFLMFFLPTIFLLMLRGSATEQIFFFSNSLEAFVLFPNFVTFFFFFLSFILGCLFIEWNDHERISVRIIKNAQDFGCCWNFM